MGPDEFLGLPSFIFQLSQNTYNNIVESNEILNTYGTEQQKEQIKRIFGEVERKEGMEVVDIPFKKGDAIKVIAGPFIDFTGFVETVNEDKQKVKVKVSIFGRPTPIELDFFQIELEK